MKQPFALWVCNVGIVTAIAIIGAVIYTNPLPVQ